MALNRLSDGSSINPHKIKQPAVVTPRKTAQQLGKIYSLFHRNKVVKELEVKLSQIARNELPQGESADKIILEAQWVANKVLSFSARKKTKRNFTPHVMAARLKIPLETLQKNPDFVSFVNKNHLTRTLGEIYEGKLTKVENDVLMIKCLDGGFKPWRELKEFIGKDFEGYCFTDQGLVKHNPDKWETMIPYKTLPEEERPKTFQMTLVTDTFRDTVWEKGTEFEDHSWIRLTKPSGEVYSFGFYPEDVLLDSPKNALATTQGIIKCPDLNEYLPLGTLTTWDLELDEKTFVRIMEEVEKRQQNKEHPLQYSVTGYNCTDFALDVMKLAGKMPQEEQVRTKITFLVPKQLYSLGKALSKVLTEKAKQLIQKRIMGLLGYEKNFKDNQLVGKGETVEKTHLLGAKIAGNVSQMTHPRTLRQKMMLGENVRMREAEMSKLKDELAFLQANLLSFTIDKHEQVQKRISALENQIKQLSVLLQTEQALEIHVTRRIELQGMEKLNREQKKELAAVETMIQFFEKERKNNLKELAKAQASVDANVVPKQ